MCPQGMNPEAHMILLKEANRVLKEENSKMAEVFQPGMEKSFNDAFLNLAKELTPYITPETLSSEQLQEIVKKSFYTFCEETEGYLNKKFEEAVEEVTKQAVKEKESVLVGGNVIEKEKVGEEAFSLFKSLSSQVEQLEKEQRLSKCILEAKTKFPHIPGEERVLGELLLNLASIPDNLQKEYIRIFELAEKYGEQMTKEIGSTSVLREAAQGDFTDEVRALQKELNCSYPEAFNKYLKLNNIGE